MSRFSAIRMLLVSMLLLAFTVDFSHAQPNFPFLKRKKSRPSAESHELSVKNGPWLIMCASFSGENSEQSAMLLANELRKHRLPAYLYRHSFDYSGAFVGLGWQQPDAAGNFDRTPKQMKAANLEIVQETAVLVGDFPSVDDGRAQQILKKIKSLPIENVSGLANEASGNSATPLRTAFFLPNPLLPEDYFRQPKIDSFIFNNNRKLKHSLLKCPGIYSVRVASFRGQSTIDQGKIRNGVSPMQSLQKDGKSTASRLIEGEEKAHDLTTLLRRKGVEAYEFHDRMESYVCIGSFDWVTRETNERVMNNPDIVKIVNACKPEVRNLPGAPNSILPKSVKGIPFDPEPTPILVPRFERSDRMADRIGFLKR